MSEPTITDWIQAIGIFLTFPTAAWGIVNLFRKDKEKERKLISLENIVETQVEIITEMKNQVVELQKQSIILSDSNELLREQNKIQFKALINDKEYKHSMLEIENKKHLNTIRPEFNIYGSGFSSAKYHVEFVNIGNRGFRPRLDNIQAENIRLYGIPKIEAVDTNGHIRLEGERQSKTYGEWLPIKASAELIFEDVDGNEYKQEIQFEKTTNIKKPILTNINSK